MMLILASGTQTMSLTIQPNSACQVNTPANREWAARPSRPAHQLSGSQLRAPQAESLAIQAKGSRAMHRPRINEHSTAGLFATSVASIPSLTGRSTRTSMLRMAAG
jgi:hypothetical protein